jgi:long-chain acyl-CoA synthetase
MNIASLLHASARRAPLAAAVSFGLRPVHSYRSLSSRVAGIAGGLRALGLRSGDRVVLAMSNCPEFFEIMWGCWHAGLCIVPINARLHAREISYVFDHAQAQCCFATSDLIGTVAAAATEAAASPYLFEIGSASYQALGGHDAIAMDDVRPGAAAWIFYTSGTTGRPKGAVLSHSALFAMSWRYYADIDHLSPKDTMIHATPLSHATGLYAIPHIAKGTHNIVCEAPIGDIGAILELVNHQPHTSFILSPPLLVRMAAHPALATTKIDNIRTILYGSAPMYYENLTAAIAVFGPRFWQGYGQGETPCTITHLDQAMHGDSNHPRYAERLASVGVARTGVDVRIVDDAGVEMPHGEIGEIVCRSDVSMTEYWANPPATASALQNGWLHTGDLGSMDADGFLTLKDRAKDLIITEGLNVYPREVEEILLKHRTVVEVAVVGRVNLVKGEDVVAYIVTSDPALADADLVQTCRENLADYKWPTTFVRVAELPRNSGGKVLKTELRDRLVLTS